MAEFGLKVLKLGPRVAKLGPRKAKLGPKVAKLGPKVAKLGRKVTKLGPQGGQVAAPRLALRKCPKIRRNTPFRDSIVHSDRYKTISMHMDLLRSRGE